MRLDPVKETNPRGRLRARTALALVALLPLTAFATQVGDTAPAAAVTSRAPWASGQPGAGNDPITAEFIRTVGARTIDNQEALSNFRAWMLKRPDFAASGYVGTIDDLAHKATTIMWYGPRTSLLSAILHEGAQRGIAVSVQPRAHSLQQIDAAIDAIW